MTTRTSDKISSSRLIQSTKRDGVNRSHASSVSNSNRRIDGSMANVNAGGPTSSHSTRVYLDGVDVTPQSLLMSRIKSTAVSDSKGRSKGSKAKNAHGVGASSLGGVSMAGASMFFSHASSNSADNDSDNESTSSIGAVKTRQKEVKLTTEDPVGSSTKQEEDKNVSLVAAGSSTDADVVQEDGKHEAVQVLDSTSNLALVPEVPVQMRKKTVAGYEESTLGRGCRPITVMLGETATEMLFELRSVCVALDAPHHTAVAARNKRYQAICAQKKGSDKYVEGRTQTLQLAQKVKEVMTAPPATRDAACIATDWDIYDCGKLENTAEMDEVSGGSGLISSDSATAPASSEGQTKESGNGIPASATGTEGAAGGGVSDTQLKEQVEEIVGATLASPGCILDVDGDIVEDLRARQHRASRPRRKVRDKHSHSSGYSQKSRVSDSQRSNGVITAAVSGDSTASVVPMEQNGGSMSASASQDFAGFPGGANSGNATINSQAGASMVNVSRSVLSKGGATGGSGDTKSDNVYARANTNVDIGETIAYQRTAHVLRSKSLLLKANIVERAVQQNVYHEQHVKYRDFPMLETVDIAPVDVPKAVVPAMDSTPAIEAESATSSSNGSKSMDGLEELWAFRCELTQDRAVLCFTWNTVNEDLLAVSYAQATQAEVSKTVPSVATLGTNSGGPTLSRGNNPVPRQSTANVTASRAKTNGLVLFWSLTNPEYPERIYHLPVSVTSIDFSTAHPYLLAVGFADGVVSIYDTRKDDFMSCSSTSTLVSAADTTSIKHIPVPITTSSGMTGKHLDAVWQVRWVARNGGESVVSVSADGRVVEWSLKKGLSHSDLMTLKRMPNPLLGGAGTAATGTSGGIDGVISRQASGRSLAFASQGDPSVYFVGTEDGLVHKCSVSYNEQYLQTYIGHTGPVYQLLVSPFCHDIFLSCSGDWSLKLWHQGDPHSEAVLTFHSMDLAKAVLGASWSPSNAGVFAAVTEDGRIELWDLIQSTLDPIVRHFPQKFISVAVPVPQSDGSNLHLTDLTRKDELGSDELDNISQDVNAVSISSPVMVQVPLECTTVAFAPKAPVLVVGDSTGDVTVYRVPRRGSNCIASELFDAASSIEDQAAHLMRAIYPNKHE